MSPARTHKLKPPPQLDLPPGDPRTAEALGRLDKLEASATPSAQPAPPERRRMSWETAPDRERKIGTDIPERLHAKMAHLLYLRNEGLSPRQRTHLKSWVAATLESAVDRELVKVDPALKDALGGARR